MLFVLFYEVVETIWDMLKGRVPGKNEIEAHNSLG